MKKLLIICLLVFLTAGSVAFADDLFPPPWRGEEGSTYQEWSFWEDNTTPTPDFVDNIYGDPLLTVNTPYNWLDAIDSREGVWPLSGEIDVYIPNWPVLRPEKVIWIQLTWK